MCVYTHTDPSSISWKNPVELLTPWKQEVLHLAPKAWFLNTIFHLKKTGLLWKMANARAGVEKTQDKPGMFTVPNERKCLKNNGDMSEVHQRAEPALRGSHQPSWDITWMVPKRFMIKLITTAPPLVSKHYLFAKLTKGQTELCFWQDSPQPHMPSQILPATPLQTSLFIKRRAPGRRLGFEQIVHLPQRVIGLTPSCLICLFTDQIQSLETHRLSLNPQPYGTVRWPQVWHNFMTVLSLANPFTVLELTIYHLENCLYPKLQFFSPFCLSKQDYLLRTPFPLQLSQMVSLFSSVLYTIASRAKVGLLALRCF